MNAVMFKQIIYPVTLLLLLASGCKKTESTPIASAPQPASSAPTAPTATAAPTPPDGATAASAPAASEPGAVSGPTETTPVAAANGVKIFATSGTGLQWALKQDEIKNDPQAQWASAATASSCYSDCTSKDGYSTFQATGPPNVDQESDRGEAWASKTPDAGIEWLDLTFPKQVFANGIRIRESDNAGAIVKVDLYDDQGKVHPLWSGSDPTKGLNYFILTFPKTDFQTNRLKITLATNLVPGFNEIDAVQLLGAPK